jgi:hypothetical protein
MLGRDSLLDQRIDVSLDVQGVYGGVDGSVESLDIGEGLVGQMMRFEIVPDNFDVIECGSCSLEQKIEQQILTLFSFCSTNDG